MKTRTVTFLTSEELDTYIKEEGFTKYCNELDQEARDLGVIPERCEYCNADLELDLEVYCSPECEELAQFNF